MPFGHLIPNYKRSYIIVDMTIISFFDDMSIIYLGIFFQTILHVRPQLDETQFFWISRQVHI